MKKLLFLLALFCFSCDERHPDNQPVKRDYTVVGRIDNCSALLKFVDGNNVCYVMDYCGSGNATVSCLKNEMAPSK